ncbi:MAG: right-handed parallel beta-helix repeat-containing protein [archaeon]
MVFKFQRKATDILGNTTRIYQYDFKNNATVVTNSSGIYGFFQLEDELFNASPIGENYYIITKIDNLKASKYGEKDDYVITKKDTNSFNESKNESPSGISATTQTGSSPYVIDIFVAYTQAAAYAYSSDGNISPLISAAMGNAKATFINSNINITFNLVGTTQYNYSESGVMETELEYFAGIGDGIMDDIHSLRTQYGADVCVLITATGQYAGLAANIPANYSTGFCVVKYDYAANQNSFTHEIGHLMGSRHQYPLDASGTIEHGYFHNDTNLANKFRTIMAIKDEKYGWTDTRIPYWSDPNGYYGVYIRGDSHSDNHTFLNSHGSDLVVFNPHIVSGQISSNTTWANNYGQINLGGNVTVNNGVTLTIASSANIDLKIYSITVSSSGIIIVENEAAIKGYLLKTGGVIKGIYPTIQAALSAATNGQTVTVASGVHNINSNLSVPSGVILQINSEATMYFNPGTQLTVNGTLLADGATFNCSQSGVYWGGIKLTNANSSSYIKNSTISGFGSSFGTDGIYIEGCSPLIQNNYISGNYNGIKVYGASPVIENNRIEYCWNGNGITVENGSTPRINGNNIKNIYYHGISVYGGNRALIYDNTLNNCGFTTRNRVGIRVYGSNVDAHTNNIQNCAYGFWVESYSNVNFGKDYGAYVFATNNVVQNCPFGLIANANSIIDAGSSVYDGFAACHNKITEFTNYALQATSYSTIYAEKNYWGSSIDPAKYNDATSSIVWNHINNWDGGPGFYKAVLTDGSSSDDEEDVIGQSLVLIDKKDYNSAKKILRLIIDKGSIKALNPLLKLFFSTHDPEIKTYLENISKNAPDKKNTTSYKEALLKLYYGIGEYKSALGIADELIASGKQEVKIDKFLIYALGFRDNNTAISILDEIEEEMGIDKASELYTLLLPDNGEVDYNLENKFVYKSNNDIQKPTEYALLQNYPNPFNPSTVINFDIPQASKVSLRVYDMLGKEVATLVDGYKEIGSYSVRFNASSLPSGMYIYEIRANNFIRSGKMLLLK